MSRRFFNPRFYVFLAVVMIVGLIAPAYSQGNHVSAKEKMDIENLDIEELLSDPDIQRDSNTIQNNLSFSDGVYLFDKENAISEGLTKQQANDVEQFYGSMTKDEATFFHENRDVNVNELIGDNGTVQPQVFPIVIPAIIGLGALVDALILAGATTVAVLFVTAIWNFGLQEACKKFKSKHKLIKKFCAASGF
jgi:hypothetical protein